MKAAGKRSAGKPHAAFDEGGRGNLASTLLSFVVKQIGNANKTAVTSG